MAFLNFWTSPYELFPIEKDGESALTVKKNLLARTGVLLKFEFSNEGFGYADLHPWTAFGDQPLLDHLQSLKTSSPTGLAKVALENAYTDAQFRMKKQALFGSVERVRNNALMTDLHSRDIYQQVQNFERQGYDSLKIKISPDLVNEIPILKKILSQTNMRIRLDSNARLSFQQAADFLKLLTTDEKAKIEYFEDPCPFDKNYWNELRKAVPVALDWESTNAFSQGLPKAWDVIVIKPARQNLQFWIQVAQKNDSMITVTSAMDHPLGVMQALVKAAELKTKLPERALISGCQTIQLYQPSEFSSFFKTSGPFLFPTDSLDIGLGFSKALEGARWS